MKILILIICSSILVIALLVFIAKDYWHGSKKGASYKDGENQTNMSKQDQNTVVSKELEKGDRKTTGMCYQSESPDIRNRMTKKSIEAPISPTTEVPLAPKDEETYNLRKTPSSISADIPGPPVMKVQSPPDTPKKSPLANPTTNQLINQQFLSEKVNKSRYTPTKIVSKTEKKVEPAESTTKTFHGARGEYIHKFIGIRNQKLSCYANAMFQCFNSVDHLRNYFLTYEGTGKVTSLIQTIIKQLNSDQTEPLDIHKSLESILVELGKYSLMSMGGNNEIVTFYLTIISCCIIEDYQLSHERMIFYDSAFFEKLLNEKKKNLMDFLVLDLPRKYHGLEIDCQFRPYIGIECKDGESINEKLQIKSNQYLGPVHNNKVLVIIIQNSDRKDTNHIVPTEVTFFERKYHLRSFIVGGTFESYVSHFYAHILRDNTLYELNDSQIGHEDYKDTKKYKNIRFLFYEVQEN